MEEPVMLVSGTDGAGTVAIAQLLNRHNTRGARIWLPCALMTLYPWVQSPVLPRLRGRGQLQS